MKRLLVFLVLIPSLAVAGPIKKSKRNSLEKKVDKLAARLGSIPGRRCISKEVASSLEVPQHWECRLEEILETGTTDDMGHNVNLLVETSTSSVESGPRRLIFMTFETASDRRSDDYYTFVTSLDGELLKALAIHGKLDEKGGPVKGSGIDVPQDLKDKDIRSRFNHELEFWLDGKYRKKQKKS